MTHHDDTIREVTLWLLEQGNQGTPYDILFEQLCLKLNGRGMTIMRANFSMRALHPEIGGFAYRWKRVSGIAREQYAHNDASVSTGWDKSPLKYLIETSEIEDLHRSLRAEDKPYQFPMFEDLAAQGATEYFAQKLSFANGTEVNPRLYEGGAFGMLASWSADENGFSAEDLTVLRAILPAIGLAMKSLSNYETARDLLTIYLGQDAAGRVMSGNIMRGSAQDIEAVILLFDLSNFTRLSEELPGPDVIEMLNDYYAMVVAEIERRGGNVLKFMGDGLLAVFTAQSETEAGARALDTAQSLRKGMAELNAERAANGVRVTDCTIALHAGLVLYGNIGGTTRLDFTVIGPAVNVTARLSGMCGNVDQAIVVSDRVARPHLAQRSDLVSLGQYRLRGVADRMELFTLD